MLKNSGTIGVYIPGNSILHQADPRIKILCLTLLTITILVVHSLAALALCLTFIIILSAFIRMPIFRTLKGLLPMWFLVSLSVISNIFTIHGTQIFAIGKISISQEWAISSLALALRLAALVIVSAILTFTTSSSALAYGIEYLLIPLKVIGINSREIGTMLSIAIKFIPVLLDEFHKISKAQIARGVDPSCGNIFKRTKEYIPILIPIVINSLSRADRLAIAMESRCYGLHPSPTRLKQLRLNHTDFNLLFITIFCCLVMYFI